MSKMSIIVITDGLPTAHFQEEKLFLLYPPHPLTEEATMREGLLCKRENITINMFLIPSWSQSEEDIQFAYRLAESTTGRVFFTSGKDLDRFVVWDYVNRRRTIISWTQLTEQLKGNAAIRDRSEYEDEDHKNEKSPLQRALDRIGLELQLLVRWWERTCPALRGHFFSFFGNFFQHFFKPLWLGNDNFNRLSVDYRC